MMTTARKGNKGTVYLGNKGTVYLILSELGKLSPYFLSLLFLPAICLAEAVNFDEQSITIALTQEPPNLNTMETTDLVSFFVLGHTMEGLTRYDQRGRLVAGVAESWELGDLEATFRLRKNARWSDGRPVTAHDFVFAWQHIVDPASAAPYASIHYPILNAQAIHKGAKPVSTLGVSAPDDLTLKVSLQNQCGYFLKLMAHAAFFPVRQDFFNQQQERYAAEAGNLLYNGPFKLVDWVHGASLTMQKNYDYWDAWQINLEEIKVGYITADNRARLNLFRDNRIALVRLDGETIKDAAKQRLKVRTFVTGGVAFLRFNFMKGSPTENLHIRRAIQAVFNPDLFVNRIMAIPGYKPAHSFFPSWLAGVDDKFQREYPVEPAQIDELRARELISTAREELTVDRIPELVLLTVASPTGNKISEFLQGLLKAKLGIDLRIDSQTFKQYLAKSRNGEFDLLLSSWFPDFDDIMTYADLLGSGNANNRGGYVSEQYDEWLQILQGASDQRVRMDAAAELQKIIMDEVMVLPMAETGSAYTQHSQLRGVVRRVLGADPDYTYAEVIEYE
jgi:oligopeptide transport system substrate-binding protein|tara:strand:- start:4331 stop:6016 length:1686 start_codon:yes stop_codon:yes gene_type:complete